MNDVHEVLVKARNVLVSEGWRQGGWTTGEDDRGPYCAHGAIMRVCGAYQVGGRFDVRLQKDALQAVERIVGLPIITFNDSVATSPAEVLAAFDRAILASAPEPDVSWLGSEQQAALSAVKARDQRAVVGGVGR